MSKLSVVDLFAGAGGLSLGFEETQDYELKVAFENNPDMQKTYRFNHPSVDVQGDVCSADYADIRRKIGEIDVVIGGPPCQGFSNANRQKNHVISKNNMLVKQYIRAIVELQPKAFVMENVSMLKSDVHRFFMDKNDESFISKHSVQITETPLPLIDNKYIFDGALEIIKNADLIKKYLWDDAHYTELNVVYKASNNRKKLIDVLNKHKSRIIRISQQHLHNDTEDYIFQKDTLAFSTICDYYENKISVDSITDAFAPAIMIQRMLNKAKEIIDSEIVVNKYENGDGIAAIVKSFAVFDYIKAVLASSQNGYVLNSGILNAADFGAPQRRMRFVIIGVKKTISSTIDLPKGEFDSSSYRTVRDAIGDLENIEPIKSTIEDTGMKIKQTKLSGLGKLLRNNKMLRNHIITNSTETALKRFRALKQGENFHSLAENMKVDTYSDVSRTQNTIYLRLNYDEPCGTVVNVRKSMWIHPTKDRAISIREAARLQTFPDSFIFCGSKDHQYQQVGNAVPPIMAKAIAKKLAQLLNLRNL